MPVRKVQVGQVWKMNSSGETYLITKVYNEALKTFAVLRKAGAEGEAPIRVHVERAAHGQFDLPGFTYAQEADEF